MQCDATQQCEAVFRLYDYEKTAHIDAREVRTCFYRIQCFILY